MRHTLVLALSLGLGVATPAFGADPVTPTAPTVAAKPPAPAIDPATLPLEPGEGAKVAEALAVKLLASFTIPAHAKDYAATLRARAAAGAYAVGTRGDLVRRLTDDLQAVHKDGHLRVMVPRPAGPDGSGAGRPGPDFPPLIQSAKTIAPGIAYIRFTAFLGEQDELAGVSKWLAENENARMVIFDLRNHHGGGLAEQDLIFAYLFDRPTPLVKLSVAKAVADRDGFPFDAAPTLVVERSGELVIATHSALPGKDTALRRAKVLLLVSNRTASAAEHFSLALKSTGRATLIGEATAGANHFGGIDELTEHFAVWMPVGRTYDIATGQDWEGVGVAPDIAADPKAALRMALEQAGLSPAEAARLDALEVPAEPVHRDKVPAR